MKRASFQPQRKTLPLGLQVFFWVSISSTMLALIASWKRSVESHTHFGSDGLWVSDFGFDYFDYYSRFLERHSSTFFTSRGYPWYYPAPAFLVHYPFYVLAHRTHSLLFSYFVYVAAVGLCSSLVTVQFVTAMRRAGLAEVPAMLFAGFCLLSSYPLYFAAQRGNIEGLTWILVAAGLTLLVRRRERAAALCLGVAGAMKLYPFLFVALFLKRGRKRQLVWIAATAVAITCFSLYFLEPALADSFHRVLGGVKAWTVTYAEAYRDPEWDHSLFGAVKVCFHASIRSYHRALLWYYVLAGAAALLAYLLRVRRMPETNQILFLACAAISLPPTSFDYTLVMLYVPFAPLVLLAIRRQRKGDHAIGLVAAMICFGLLMTPTTYLASSATPGLPGLVKAVCLLSLLILACSTPFELPPQGQEPWGSELPMAVAV